MKETIKIQAEIHEKEMKEIIVKISKTKSWNFEKINKTDKHLAILIKKKREKNQINKLRNEKKKKLQQKMQKYKGLLEYYKKLYDNKMDNLEEMDWFNLPRLNQEEIEIMNNPITSIEIEVVIKISQKTKAQDQMASQENSIKHFRSVHSLYCVRLFVTPWTAARQASLSITNSQSLSKPMLIESGTPSSHLILCHLLLLLPPILLSIRVFTNESTLHMRWPKYWSFSFSISPSNEHPGLISFRMDWLDLLAVSQESSPTPQFKSIIFSVISFLHSPTLTSIHDHWKNHSLDQTDLCWQSNVSAF